MTLLEIGDAWELVAAACAEPLPAETVPLDAATGRIASEDALSAIDLPPFDRSAMDGYAVRAQDTDPPRALAVAGELAAGEVASSALAPGSRSCHHDGRRAARGRRRDTAHRGRAGRR